jgi:ABC-type nitrate/sulfonate/bicarbonate transport system substrate-binding protein
MRKDRGVMTIGRRRAIAGAGGVAASLVAGAAAGQSAPAVKGSGSKVLFGIGLSAPFLPFVPWVDKGIAAKHGINAEYKIFESGLGGVEAVVAGNSHICIGSEVNMSRPRLSGGSIVSVARSLVARRDQGIGVGPGIDKPADFKGKTVAVIRTTGADYLLSRFLEKHNLREGTGPEEVKVITVQPAEWIPAIQRGDINAFFGWEPWLSKLPQIIKGAKVYAWASDDNLYNQWLFAAFREDWAKKNPELAGAVYNSLADATDWALANKEEAIDMCAKKFRLNRADFAQQVSGVDYVFDTKREYYDRYKVMLSWAISRGYLKIDNLDKFVTEAYYPDVARKYAPSRTDF